MSLTAPKPTTVEAEATQSGMRRVVRWLGAVGDIGFVLPVLVLMAMFILIPTCTALFRSFYDWEPGYPSYFAGFDNYVEIAQDEVFREVLRNSAVYLLGVPLWTLVPLMVALLIYERVPAAGLLRTIYFFPSVVSPAALGILTYALLQPEGLVNATLETLGLGFLASDWVDNPALVKPTIIAFVGWAGLGFGVLIFSAALAAIPPELFEAAEVDGASWWQRLRHVMLPGIRSLVQFHLVFGVLTVFLFLFGWVFTLTQGGPGYSSTTMDFDIWQRALGQGQFGAAAAEAVYVLLLVAVIAGVGFRLAGRSERSVRTSPRAAWREDLNDRVGDGRKALAQALAPLGRLRPRWTPFPSITARYSVGRTVILFLLAILYVYPLLYMVGTALKYEDDFIANPAGLPTRFTTQFISYVWTTVDMGGAMLNSLIAVSIGVTVTTIASTAGAFWFFRHRGRVPNTLFVSILGVSMLPFPVYVLPFFVMLSRVGLIDNLYVLGLVYGASFTPFGLWIMRSYMEQGISREVLESAEVDGASLWQQFWRIVVPLAKPALATVIALTFVFTWGEFFLSLILLQDETKFTVVLSAASLVSRYEPAVQETAAAAMFTIAPVFIVFLFAQRAIVRGFTAGIGKG